MRFSAKELKWAVLPLYDRGKMLCHTGTQLNLNILTSDAISFQVIHRAE